MKVLISKQAWIKATCNIEGKFWCPFEWQKKLLDVWPNSVEIEVEATIKKKNP